MYIHETQADPQPPTDDFKKDRVVTAKKVQQVAHKVNHNPHQPPGQKRNLKDRC